MSPRSLLCLLGCLGLAAAACGETDRTLKVTGLEPVRGDAAGDTPVLIKGNGFTVSPRKVDVYFGKPQAYHKGTVVRFENDKQMLVRSPGGNVGETVDVLLVFEPGGQLVIPNAFTFIDKSGAGPSINDLDTNKDKRDKK